METDEIRDEVTRRSIELFPSIRGGVFSLAQGVLKFTGWKSVLSDPDRFVAQWVFMGRKPSGEVDSNACFYCNLPNFVCESFTPGATFKLGKDGDFISNLLLTSASELTDEKLLEWIPAAYNKLRCIVNEHYGEEVLIEFP